MQFSFHYPYLQLLFVLIFFSFQRVKLLARAYSKLLAFVGGASLGKEKTRKPRMEAVRWLRDSCELRVETSQKLPRQLEWTSENRLLVVNRLIPITVN